jgi:hypothetical protein
MQDLKAIGFPDRPCQRRPPELKARRLVFQVEVLTTDHNLNSTAEAMREKVEIAVRSVLDKTLHVRASTQADEEGDLSFERFDSF